MAIFRKIHTSFWSDTFIQDLDNEQKLFYMYLLTNERTKQCGIYEISKKQMSFDLGYSMDKVTKLLKFFVNSGRILYCDETKEIALKNWNKYNGSTSPKVVSCVKSELSNVKYTVLIEYVNGIYTESQQEEEQEEEQEEKKENIDSRKNDFAKSLQPYLDIYGKDMLNEFFLYWTEPNQKNTKMKYELEPTWSFDRRLNTWSKQSVKFGTAVSKTEKPKFNPYG